MTFVFVVVEDFFVHISVKVPPDASRVVLRETSICEVVATTFPSISSAGSLSAVILGMVRQICL